MLWTKVASALEGLMSSGPFDTFESDFGVDNKLTTYLMESYELDFE